MNMTPKITCRDTTWLVSDSQDRRLSEAESRALEQHITECPLCSKASIQFEVLFRHLRTYFNRETDKGDPR
ncbi:zf-HC2 domain-containing protein [Hyphomicrobium sp. DY-1]|uniref:zf-HC2 domain-containing protein n=1 Tax=Hyphomicrobium sp. DY-1 TaxID=3075650 RepID=UPI0039C448BC